MYVCVHKDGLKDLPTRKSSNCWHGQKLIVLWENNQRLFTINKVSELRKKDNVYT